MDLTLPLDLPPVIDQVKYLIAVIRGQEKFSAVKTVTAGLEVAAFLGHISLAIYTAIHALEEQDEELDVSLEKILSNKVPPYETIRKLNQQISDWRNEQKQNWERGVAERSLENITAEEAGRFQILAEGTFTKDTPIVLRSAETDRYETYLGDAPGPGGAYHSYQIYAKKDDHLLADIQFQKGGIAEKGVNGVTHELLLAVCGHRLKCFQAGPFPHPENGTALVHIRLALEALDRRTAERVRMGKEGLPVA